MMPRNIQPIGRRDLRTFKLSIQAQSLLSSHAFIYGFIRVDICLQPVPIARSVKARSKPATK
jgi:hypothetical protein